MFQQLRVLTDKTRRRGQRLSDVVLFDELGQPVSLGAGPKLTPRSDGGDLWMSGVDFTYEDDWQDNSLVGALLWGGRVSFFGSIARSSGSSAVIPFFLPPELVPRADAIMPVGIEAGPDYANVVVSARVKRNSEFRVFLPTSVGTNDVTVWLDGLSYVVNG